MAEKGKEAEELVRQVIGIKNTIDALAQDYGSPNSKGVIVAVAYFRPDPHVAVKAETVLLVSRQEDGEAKIIRLSEQKQVVVTTIKDNGDFRKRIYEPRYHALELAKSYQRPEGDELIKINWLMGDVRVKLAQQGGSVMHAPQVLALLSKISTAGPGR